MQELSSRHLLGIKNITENDIQLILHTAKEFKEVINRPIKKVPSLRDITIANVFFENSTRTRLSFELAEKRLSADTINFSSAGSSVKKGETLYGIARKYGISVEKLIEINGLKKNPQLLLGQKIKLVS